jgi:Calx-beta domain-containing protein
MFSLASILSLLLALWGSTATSASIPLATAGYLDFSYSGVTVSVPTGEKPESKLWWNDGFWWGSLYNSAAGDYHIYRLNWGTQTWEDTGTVLDDRPDSRADTLWDDVNKKLYVASHIFTTASSHTTNTLNKGRLYRYSYNSATQTYSLDPGFYVNVNDDQTETLVLDKDVDGRLWTTFVSRPSGSSDHQVYVNATNLPAGLANDGNWPTTPFSLGSIFPEAHVMTDDISSLVAFGTGVNGKIGIMWSNQLSNTVTFAVHDDANSSYTLATDWITKTVPIPIAPDDHISLKSVQATPQGQVFAALKTAATNPSDPQVILVAYDVATDSFVLRTYSTKADNDSRPIAVVDQSTNTVYVFVAGKPGGQKICYKSLQITTPLSAMGDFLPTGDCGTPFIADPAFTKIDSATSFKRPADSTTGIVVLASDDLNGEFYVHGVLDLTTPPPVITARSPNFNATGVPVNSAVSVTFSKVMNQSTLTDANFTLTSSSGAVAGTRSYNPATRTWTFTPDSLLRANTTFTATISGSVQDTSNQSLYGGDDTWTFTTAPPTVQFSSTNYSVSEATATATITVTLNVSSTTSVNVNYATSDGTATAPSDYTPASNTLTFSPGQTSGTFSVTIVNDLVQEPVETVNLALSTPVNDVLGTPITATLSILDNDAPPTVQFSPAAFSVSEGSGPADIAVGLSHISGVPVTVTYSTSAGTATAGLDYTDTTGQIVFNPGEALKTFPVTLVPDTLDESDETVHLALTNPISATLGAPDDQATLTILDDDPQPTVQFSASGYSVNEASSTATITATLSAPSGLTVTVGYATSNVTALAGSDYVTATDTLTFTAGVTNATFTVPILPDALDEANEIVNLALSTPNNATLGATSAATLTIVDDDPTPTVQFSSSTYSWDENLGAVTITATLSAPSGQTVSVDYATSDGTATANSDYLPVSDTLDFAPGVTLQTFTMAILDDVAFEGNETVNLTLSNPIHATLGAPGTAILTILDNERIYLPLIMR